jgi:hypothetical protein
VVKVGGNVVFFGFLLSIEVQTRLPIFKIRVNMF